MYKEILDELTNTNMHYKVSSFITHEEERARLREAMSHKKRGTPLSKGV